MKPNTLLFILPAVRRALQSRTGVSCANSPRTMPIVRRSPGVSDPYPPHLPMTHAPFSSAEPRKQIPFRKRMYLYWSTVAMALSSSVNAQILATNITGSGINYNSSVPSITVHTAVLPGVPDRLYMIRLESGANNTHPRQVRVSVYNSYDAIPSWMPVDSRVNGVVRAANQGINRDPTVNVPSDQRPVLAVHNSELYASWSEGATGQLRVAKYNGDDLNPNWIFVDGNSATVGLNRLSSKYASKPHMASFEGKLFVAWEEVNENKRTPRRQIRVKAYNGTSFSFVESGAVAGLNQNSLNDAYTAFLAVHNAKLFITFHEKGQVRVKVYAGGTTWNFTDGGGTTGINRDPGSYADLSQLISFNGKLYAGIRQDLKMRMLSYDGVSWQYADGSSASQGLNYDPAQRTGRPILEVHNGMLYLAWMEQNSSTKYTVRMRALNPNAIVPSFDFVDGGAQYGISFDLSQNAALPVLSSANAKLYLGLVGADAQTSVPGLDQAMAAVMNNE